MLKFPVTFLLVFVAWILVTFSLDVQELAVGAVVSLAVAYISKDYMFHDSPGKVLNPARWARGIVYFFAWLYLEIAGNLDVAYRILTGRINPAIIRIPTGFRSDIGKALFGNSVTLTPGTLTIKAGRDMYVHWIAYGRKRDVGGLFERFGLGVTE
jgi:multicomponent Na+:H+ antiporter subunit E